MAEKKTWSLQDDKRTEAERNIFKPTGKSAKQKYKGYLLVLAAVLLLVSFLMTYFSETTLGACVFGRYFNTKDDVALYSLYVFSTLLIILAAGVGAYLVGKRLGDRIKG